MTYLPALIVAAVGVLVLLVLAGRLVILLRRFRAVTDFVSAEVNSQTTAVRDRADAIRARRIAGSPPDVTVDDAEPSVSRTMSELPDQNRLPPL